MVDRFNGELQARDTPFLLCYCRDQSSFRTQAASPLFSDSLAMKPVRYHSRDRKRDERLPFARKYSALVVWAQHIEHISIESFRWKEWIITFIKVLTWEGWRSRPYIKHVVSDAIPLHYALRKAENRSRKIQLYTTHTLCSSLLFRPPVNLSNHEIFFVVPFSADATGVTGWVTVFAAVELADSPSLTCVSSIPDSFWGWECPAEEFALPFPKVVIETIDSRCPLEIEGRRPRPKLGSIDMDLLLVVCSDAVSLTFWWSYAWEILPSLRSLASSWWRDLQNWVQSRKSCHFPLQNSIPEVVFSEPTEDPTVSIFVHGNVFG